MALARLGRIAFNSLYQKHPKIKPGPALKNNPKSHSLSACRNQLFLGRLKAGS
jgi:hypothetical protein